MAFVDLTLDGMLEEAEVGGILKCSRIIPSSNPDCPKEWAPPVKYVSTPQIYEVNQLEKDRTTQFIMRTLQSNCYAFAEKIETRRQKCNGMDTWIKSKNREISERLIGVALENAFYHGNRNNPGLPVYFTAFEGEKGVVLSIKDSGSGFDYREVIARARAFFEKFGGVRKAYDAIGFEKYFQRWGTAFWLYMEYPVDVSFEDNGTRVNLLFKDSECFEGNSGVLG